MSYVNRFLELVFRMEGPKPPQVTPAQARAARRKQREQQFNRQWRQGYCDEVIAILNDPAHNKTTE